jgi:hypothetical protein
MGKAAISSGGGGSVGKGVNWMDALVAQYAAPEIPADATCAEEFCRRIDKSEKRAGEILNELAKAGGWVKAFGKKAGESRARCWYWPAKQ